MRVPKAGNNMERTEEEQEMIVDMERTGQVQQEREGVENTRLREGEEDKKEEEEDRRADKEVGQSGHLTLLIALLLSVALLAIGFLVKQVMSHFLRFS